MEEFESHLHLAGVRHVAGLDEVGRGALFGPVLAAAVVLAPDGPVDGLRDSKVLSVQRRLELFRQLQSTALDWSVGWASASEVDRFNVLRATRLAMGRAVQGLRRRPDHLLIDALELDRMDIPQTAVVHGDARCRSIAAASIVAKCSRDALMRGYGRRVRGYGLTRNMGYGTAEHRRAILRRGFSELHRRTFRVQGELPFDLSAP